MKSSLPIVDKRLLFSSLLLLILPFAVFHLGHLRFGVGGLLFGDHRSLMALRESSSSEWEFLWKAANFDRYRGNSQSFLFRPGLGVFLALVDIFFRSNFYVIGSISLVMTGLISLVLLFLLRSLLPWWGALLGAVVFQVHFCGSELVVWRHIAPYGWGLLAFVLGATWLTQKKYTVAMGAFFVAALFHETYAVACLPLAACAGFSWLRAPLGISAKRWASAFLIPFAAFFFLDVATYFWIEVASQTPGYADSRLFTYSPVSYAGRWMEGFVSMTGASMADFLVPQIFTTTLDERRWAILILGPLTVALLGYTLRRLVMTKRYPMAAIFLFLSVHTLVLFVAFTSMRIMPIGLSAIGNSHYYRYFSNFTFVVMFAALLTSWPERKVPRVLLTILLAGIIANQVFFGIARQRRLGLRTDPLESRIVANLGNTIRFLGADRCYAGRSTDEIETYLPHEFLYRHSCAFLKKGEPVTGMGVRHLLILKSD